MLSAPEQGTPYPDGAAGPVDDWSARIYAALRDWPVARDGAWTRWEPGYLLLTIDHARGREIDKIVLYTADELLTVAFGWWDEEYPVPGPSHDVQPEAVAAEARSSSSNGSTAHFGRPWFSTSMAAGWGACLSSAARIPSHGRGS